jgi:cysteine synthase
MSREPLSGRPGTMPASWSEVVRGIGETPMTHISVRLNGRECALMLKLEGHNPFGSIKDRTAYGLIRSIELAGPSDVTVDMTDSAGTGSVGSGSVGSGSVGSGGSGSVGSVAAAGRAAGSASLVDALAPATAAGRPGGDGVPGTPMIVESTSGNLGVALAGMCALRGYAFTAVVDPKIAPENLSLMERLGAKVERVSRADEKGNYLGARIRRVREIVAGAPNAYWSNQYANVANPLIHCLHTGPEIWRQAGPDLDAVYLAVSTGGTLSGVAAYLRAVSPRTRIVGVDVHGSVALGGAPGVRELTGIGASRRSRFVDRGHVADARWVGDAEAVAVCRLLAAETGVLVGGSAGATIAACLRHLEEDPSVRRAVCLCADDGSRYLSTIYDDDWIRGRAIDPGPVLDRLAAGGLSLTLTGPAPPAGPARPGPAGPAYAQDPAAREDPAQAYAGSPAGLAHAEGPAGPGPSAHGGGAGRCRMRKPSVGSRTGRAGPDW